MIFPIVCILIIVIWVYKTLRANKINSDLKRIATERGSNTYVDMSGVMHYTSDDLPVEFFPGDDGDVYERNPYNRVVRRNVSQEARDYYAAYALEWAIKNDLRFYPYEDLHEDHRSTYGTHKQKDTEIEGYRFKDRFSDNIYVRRKFRDCHDVIFWFNIKTKQFDFIDKEFLKQWGKYPHIIEDVEKKFEEVRAEQEIRLKEQKERENSAWVTSKDNYDLLFRNVNWNREAPEREYPSWYYPFPIPKERYTPTHP